MAVQRFEPASYDVTQHICVLEMSVQLPALDSSVEMGKQPVSAYRFESFTSPEQSVGGGQ